MGTLGDMHGASDSQGGHSDELGRDVGVELVDALLRRDTFRQLLTRIGGEPEGIRLKPISRRDPAAARWDSSRTRRAQRLYILELALRGVLTYDELDRLAIMASDDRRWGMTRPALAIEGHVTSGRHGPTPGTVIVAARSLADCASAALRGESENLSDDRKRALHAVLRFLDLNRRRDVRKPTAVAAKKRRQRERDGLEKRVAAERRHLDQGVSDGHLVQITDGLYVARRQ